MFRESMVLKRRTAITVGAGALLLPKTSNAAREKITLINAHHTS
jgi:hypothetical protein